MWQVELSRVTNAREEEVQIKSRQVKSSQVKSISHLLVHRRHVSTHSHPPLLASGAHSIGFRMEVWLSGYMLFLYMYKYRGFY